MFTIYHGEDSFSQDEAITELKTSLGDPAAVELNYAVFDGRAAFSLSDLRATCDAFPFLAARRVVVVDGLLTRLLGQGDPGEEGQDGEPAGKGRGKGAAARELLDPLAEYLPHVPPTTELIFLERRELPARHPLLKLAASGAGAARLFGPPQPGDLPGWIAARAKRWGGAFSPQAAQMLAQHAGGDLRALDHEVAKLLTYTGGRAVEPRDVQELVPATGEANVFNMVDALGQRKTRQAAIVLHRLFDLGEHPLGLMAMIVRQFRLLIEVKELVEAGKRAPDIARDLRLAPFVVDKLTRQARPFSMPQLERIYHQLLDLDVAIKSGETDPEIGLDAFVAGLE